ncbi:T9SS type A sorting domain-containing protein [Flavobacterium sp. RHBU_3]|uniref:DUF7619 domain-containing protein n=1 Tax=Flavobacterium sp. RHBU_3 TaxID=3391184 RepID=UPI0039853D5E
MKNTLLFLFLLVAGVNYAQVVNIPDANFKNYLLNYPDPIDTNNDGEIQVSEAIIITHLSVEGSQIYNFQGIESFTNLVTLDINVDWDQDAVSSTVSNLNLTGLVQLQSFIVAVTDLHDITFGGNTQLTDVFISVSDNDLVSVIPLLDFSGCTNLQQITVLQLNVSNINIDGCAALQNFYYVEGSPNEGISEMDFSSCGNLEFIYLHSSTLESMILTNHPYLTDLMVYGSNLYMFDASGCPAISRIVLALGGNEEVYINLKNGNPNYGNVNSSISANAAQCYVCIDEGESFQSIGSNVILSTYCNFTPGGDHNTISGTLTLNADNNGCDSTDALLPYTAIAINDGTTTGYSYTLNGTYNFYTEEGTFAVTPQFENDWFTTSPATVTFADANNNTVTQNFCVTPNGVHNDVEVLVVPLGAAQPGFDAAYKIIYKNKGNQTLNGDVTFTYDDSILDYVLASPVETSSFTGSLSWSYSNLLPFETREIVVTLNVNSPMETPAVNIDDILPFTTTITPVSGDETPADNTFEFNQTVVGSMDPNDITCLEGATVSPDKIGEYLHYNVNFENTGTAPATFVVVKDIIDATKYDISTLQILNASHPMEARITGNKVEFYFDDINLAANGGKGNVTFKIKTLNSLTVNSSVTQQADIYFDYNWPIVTNEATTTFAVLSTGNFTKDTSVKLYPNPAKNTVNITAQGNIQTVQLYDVQGRLLQAANASGLTTAIDVSGRAAGIYFVKVITDKGTAVEKLVKE